MMTARAIALLSHVMVAVRDRAAIADNTVDGPPRLDPLREHAAESLTQRRRMPDTTAKDLLRGANLYLVGMMGAGKSTLGALMADRMGYRFFDTDTLIEQATHQTIPDIFRSAGEAEFRKIEHQVLSQLSPYTRLVVSTGGGLVLDPENWWHLRQGVVVWIDVSLEELQRRLAGNRHRPLLQRDDWPQYLETLLKERRGRYAEADIRLSVSGGEPAEAVCDRLVDRLRDRILPPPTFSVRADVGSDD